MGNGGDDTLQFFKKNIEPSRQLGNLILRCDGDALPEITFTLGDIPEVNDHGAQGFGNPQDNDQAEGDDAGEDKARSHKHIHDICAGLGTYLLAHLPLVFIDVVQIDTGAEPHVRTGDHLGIAKFRDIARTRFRPDVLNKPSPLLGPVSQFPGKIDIVFILHIGQIFSLKLFFWGQGDTDRPFIDEIVPGFIVFETDVVNHLADDIDVFVGDPFKGMTDCQGNGMTCHLNLCLLVCQHHLAGLVYPHIPGSGAVLNGKEDHDDEEETYCTDNEVHTLFNGHSIQHSALPVKVCSSLDAVRNSCCLLLLLLRFGTRLSSNPSNGDAPHFRKVYSK